MSSLLVEEQQRAPDLESLASLRYIPFLLKQFGQQVHHATPQIASCTPNLLPCAHAAIVIYKAIKRDAYVSIPPSI